MKKSELKKYIIDIVNEIMSGVNELDEEKERDYKAEYANYHSKPEQKKNRAMRNSARKKLEREGRVKKGDGKDVDHKRKLRSGGSNNDSNLRVRDRHSNRGDK